MKSFQELRASLPSNTAVITFCQFDPPTSKHDLLVQFVEKIAELYKADALIFIHDEGAIPLHRRLYYLNLLYPDMTFRASADATLAQAAASLRQRYRNLIVISNTFDSNEVPAKFDIIKTININPYISFDEMSKDAVSLALSGNFNEFRSKLPVRTRMIDARRMMNDIRSTYGEPELHLEVSVPYNEMRERYINGQIFNINDTINIEGQDMTVMRRGTNYVVLLDSNGQTVSKFLSDLKYEQ